MPQFNQFQWNQSQWNAGPTVSTNTNCWTLGQLRAALRREILDPSARWWSDAELNQYLNNWQNELQSEFEFVWGRAIGTNSLSTLTLSAIATDIMRLDAIYFTPGGTDTSTRRLSPRSPIDLDLIQRDWRTMSNTGVHPEVSYQDDLETVGFWPPPPTTGTYIFEYPKLLTFTGDTDLMSVPCWTRFSAISYGSYHAFGRFGPNQDLQKAARRQRRFEMHRRKIRKTYDAYLPEHSAMLRPGRRYIGQILVPRQNNLQIP